MLSCLLINIRSIGCKCTNFCSFLLKEKNQKFKAYTPEATNSLRSAKISENSLRSNSRDFFTLRLEFALRLFR
ncbi:hypothetical protein B5F77_05485 [Parabacteroides sp. An277]|nr:hypothetical protein B5F77_05485 [Parabacteroides sp. An277]